uniref:Peptidylamidoglycolate lyase n=1 Tax=Eptatretus burgeri TaxID=7764 RepID=A0A8C4NHF0_EPTBU
HQLSGYLPVQPQVFNLGSRKDWSQHDGRNSVIVLGKAFDPGSDLLHFCKPTAVAVDASYKEVFVADGYCNSRIIAFSLPDGKYLRHWGRAGFGLGQFNIPHDLTWAPNISQHTQTDNLPALCVSDRENGRLQCFAPKSGSLLREIRPKGVTTVFSAAYTPQQGKAICLLTHKHCSFHFIVTQTKPLDTVLLHLSGFLSYGNAGGLLYVLDARYSPIGLVLNYSTGRTISKFFAESPPFSMPHNLAILGNNSAVFVADVKAHALFKFLPQDQASRSTPKWKGSRVGLVVSPVAIIALLSAPVLILLAVGAYTAWRHRHYLDFSGRKGAGLNLGSFLARRSTHSHKGFDILSTEESDREHEDEDEDDEVVEYSASSSFSTREH